VFGDGNDELLDDVVVSEDESGELSDDFIQALVLEWVGRHSCDRGWRWWMRCIYTARAWKLTYCKQTANNNGREIGSHGSVILYYIFRLYQSI
jgi:hypothetical protein